VFYRLTDHLGSSSTLVTQAAVVSGARNYYYPYGGNRGGAAFNGQYHEAALPGGEGLSDYGARWYDARLGRFLSADTVVPGAMNPQALNRYSYVYNRPTGLTDPSGHEPIGCYNSNGTICADQGDRLWQGHETQMKRINTGGITSVAKQLYNEFSKAIYRTVSPDFAVIGLGANASISNGSVEMLLDFTRNEASYFYATGYLSGTDAFAANGYRYAGWGWKGERYPDSLSNAYSGAAMSISGGFSGEIIGVSVVGSVGGKLDPVDGGFFPNFSAVRTLTGSVALGVDLVPVLDFDITMMEYKMIGSRPQSFDSDNEFNMFVWLNPLVPSGMKEMTESVPGN
jgi:RHS repeat-associated protein